MCETIQLWTAISKSTRLFMYPLEPQSVFSFPPEKYAELKEAMTVIMGTVLSNPSSQAHVLM